MLEAILNPRGSRIWPQTCSLLPASRAPLHRPCSLVFAHFRFIYSARARATYFHYQIKCDRLGGLGRKGKAGAAVGKQITAEAAALELLRSACERSPNDQLDTKSAPFSSANCLFPNQTFVHLTLISGLGRGGGEGEGLLLTYARTRESIPQMSSRGSGKTKKHGSVIFLAHPLL